MKHTLIKLADAAMEKAADNVQRLHQQSGQPLVIWQDGRVAALKTGTVTKVTTSRKIAKRSSSVGLKK